MAVTRMNAPIQTQPQRAARTMAIRGAIGGKRQPAATGAGSARWGKIASSTQATPRWPVTSQARPARSPFLRPHPGYAVVPLVIIMVLALGAFEMLGR